MSCHDRTAICITFEDGFAQGAKADLLQFVTGGMLLLQLEVFGDHAVLDAADRSTDAASSNRSAGIVGVNDGLLEIVMRRAFDGGEEARSDLNSLCAECKGQLQFRVHRQCRLRQRQGWIRC